ncbi:hypothetical protein J4444_00650 [Candidatus Woesearchaeota archaeon]|nr:hypothetical protein [Candidatus Woesearchaeota archaeon]
MIKKGIRISFIILALTFIGLASILLFPKNRQQPLGDYFSVVIFLIIIIMFFLLLRNQIKNNYFYLGSMLYIKPIARKDHPNWWLFAMFIQTVALVFLIVFFLILLYDKI